MFEHWLEETIDMAVMTLRRATRDSSRLAMTVHEGLHEGAVTRQRWQLYLDRR